MVKHLLLVMHAMIHHSNNNFVLHYFEAPSYIPLWEFLIKEGNLLQNDIAYLGMQH